MKSTFLSLLCIFLIAADDPIHVRKQELKRHPRPGEWVGLYRTVSDLDPKQEYYASGAVYSCKHCGHFHATPITRKMIDDPRPIGITCAHCKRKDRIILDNINLPPVGYQFSQLGIAARGNYLTWWRYHGLQIGGPYWTKTDDYKITSDEAIIPPPYNGPVALSDKDWYDLYPIRTSDQSWVTGSWQWLDLDNDISKSQQPNVPRQPNTPNSQPVPNTPKEAPKPEPKKKP